MNLQESYIKIENINYDINSLFNFQASFEQLKYVIMALANAQKKTNDRVSKLENTDDQQYQYDFDTNTGENKDDNFNKMDVENLDNTEIQRNNLKNSIISVENNLSDNIILVN
jgi:hypothetical protein